ncbi:ABC transporter substrate-binding protein [Ramlibacter sp. XY19]|uniref:ABC transporter substrate-binding protein n=1 Tax=Ramlibacter paludis TaxID=2908000 RepID=UPI0023DAC294|nr:ABC transporter substrate-binding protein [Ramlibacter paludis]MCG2595318.1 ABC transporter substrate-binding protein [Ramlibacter paludis]
MKIKKAFSCVALGAAALFGASLPAHAQFSGDVIRVGLITDMSSVYADIDGQGGVEAIRMAIADAGGNVAGKKIEVLSADHQNKPDVAATKAREWFDTQGLDVLIGGTNSGTNLAMAKVAAEKKKPFISIGAATSALTNDQCTPYTLHWAYDTTALAKGTGAAVVKQGGKTWYFLTADYAFGHQLQADTTKVVEANGGKVVGSVKAPLSASDFSSFLLQAQGSKAQILGLANAGGDTINSIKAANEFGITKTMKLAGLLVFINDIHSLGLKTTQGMYLTDSWYWNQNKETRDWSRRFFDKMKRMPSSIQAGDYSAITQYLAAVKAVNSDDTDKVLGHMKKAKFNDVFMKNGYVRADGRVIHDMYLMQVKSPDKSTEPWDYYDVKQVFKGEEAWTTKAESKCALWK